MMTRLLLAAAACLCLGPVSDAASADGSGAADAGRSANGLEVRAYLPGTKPPPGLQPVKLATYFEQITYATSFGMKCDGTTDDTASFDAFVDRLLTIGGRGVLPRGVCVLDTQAHPITPVFHVARKLTIQGAGTLATVLSQHSAGDLLHFDIGSFGSVQLMDFSVTRPTGTLPTGTLFSGHAIALTAAKTAFVGPSSIIRVWVIAPSTGPRTTDGWTSEFYIENQQRFALSFTSASNAGFALTEEQRATLPFPSFPKPASPMRTTPRALGRDVADDYDIFGTDGNFSIDGYLDHPRAGGGLVGLDMSTFQGMNVDYPNFNYMPFGFRNDDTISNGDEALQISHCNCTIGFMGIYNSAGNQSTYDHNLLIHGSRSPFVGIWNRGAGLVTIDDNNLEGNGFGRSRTEGEDAIDITNDTTKDFAAGTAIAVDNNVMYNFAGNGVGIDRNTSNVNGTGNGTNGVATPLNDSTLASQIGGANGMAGNSWKYPDIRSDGHSDIFLSNRLTVGTYAGTGSLLVQKVDTFNRVSNQIMLDSGNGQMSIRPNPSHTYAQGVFGGYVGPAGATIRMGNLPAFKGGVATLKGDVTCSVGAGAAIASWNVIGHYRIERGAMAAVAFRARPETDDDSAASIGLTRAMRLALLPSAVGMTATEGSNVHGVDCTARLEEFTIN